MYEEILSKVLTMYSFTWNKNKTHKPVSYQWCSQSKKQIQVDIKIFLPSASHWCGSGFSFWLWRGSGSYQYSDPDPPDPNFHFDANPDPDPTYTWCSGLALRSNFEPPPLKCEPTWFHCEPPQQCCLPPFHFDADPDPASQIFRNHADPDPNYWFSSNLSIIQK